MRHTTRGLLLLIALPASLVLTGCAEGPLWRLGHLNPWVVSKWKDEDRLLVSLSEKRSKIESIRSRAVRMSPQEADRAVQSLAEIADNEPILMIRVDATRTLGVIPSPAAVQELHRLTKDQNESVRIAASQALGKRPAIESVAILKQVIANDSDIDVRLAATRAMGAYRNEPAAVEALGVALNDPEPALRFRAMETLAEVTGRDFGRDTRKWQAYMRGEPVPEDSKIKLVGGLPGLF